MNNRVVLTLACLAIGGSSLAAVTASDDADVREQLFKLQKDTARLLEGMARLDAALKQQQVSPACAEAASRTQDLETQVGALREAMIVSQTRLDEALAEIRALRLSLGNTGANRSGPVAPSSPGGASANPDPSTATATSGSVPTTASSSSPRTVDPGISPSDAFQAAYADYSRRLFDLALEGFQQALAADPKGPLADDSQYWIGETLLSQGKTSEAIDAFDAVISNWPNGEKRLAAEVRKGVAMFDSGRREEGTSLLKRVIESHPGTPEAQSAREFLRRKGVKV
ncbi:MAG: tetratricopeptide repeat protein [Acidobacteriota bacterium]